MHPSTVIPSNLLAVRCSEISHIKPKFVSLLILSILPLAVFTEFQLYMFSNDSTCNFNSFKINLVSLIMATHVYIILAILVHYRQNDQIHFLAQGKQLTYVRKTTEKDRRSPVADGLREGCSVT